ncbi:hypothetical protein PV08_00416 [Exophiala spinifera]|uniref:Clr5 domain-containing protein n=1 Tax=Exophiala spinifera TaxID=91928 RepID=A0A0D1YX10_9EURO|nr:uncharacterized protein PV08_00416 [Exophiala spinifera]KIW19841.1 hypothetical protein PV08_00416 [Exophiala spinifera]
MSSSRSLYHPKDAWDYWRETIDHMYLHENKTCGDIRAYLISNDFSCSERQIKNRLREWKYESKKTPSQHYLAMLSYANSERVDGYKIKFDVPKRDGRVYFSLKKIKKECDRVKKKYENAHVEFSLPSYEVAERILWDADIRISRHLAEPDDLTRSKSYPEIPGEPDGHGCYAPGRPFANYTDWTASIDNDSQVSQGELDEEYNFARLETNWASHSLLGNQISTVQIDHPNIITLNGEPLACSSPTSVVMKDFHDSQWSTCEDNDPSWKLNNLSAQTISVICAERSAALSHAVPTLTHCSDQLRFLLAILDTRILLPRIRAYLRMEESVNSFLNSETLSILMEEGYYSNSDSGECSTSLEEEFLGHRIDVDRLDISNLSPPLKALVKGIKAKNDEAGVIRLRYGLCELSDWILPGLVWMHLVLESDGRDAELKNFLSIGYTILEQAEHLEDHTAFAVPFRYIFAEFTRNSGDTAKWGQRLRGAHARITSRWGIDHPNSLAIATYMAWNDLHHGRLESAIQLLTAYVDICERRLGPHSILTVAGWALMSRALDEHGNLVGACASVAKVVERFDSDRSDLGKYRLMMMHRFGELLLRTDQLEAAETYLLEALGGRLQVCGLESGEVWSTIRALDAVFLRSGRIQQAQEFVEYFTNLFNWEQRREWAKENNVELPFPFPPSWLPDQIIVDIIKMRPKKRSTRP